MGGMAAGATRDPWRVPAADLPVDLVAVRRAIARVSDEAAALIADVDDLDIPVPDADWSAADVAAHLILVFRGFAAGIEGRLDDWGTPAGEAVVHALTDVVSPHLPPLPEQLREAAQGFLDAAASRSPDHVFGTPWYELDKTNLVGTMTCLVLGEVVLHGYDIASAAGRSWTIDPDDSRRIVGGVFPVKAPTLVNHDTAGRVRAGYELHVDGGPEFIVRFRDGTATVAPAGSSAVDCHLAGDPVAMLLLGYGRARPDDLFAEGRLRAWGGRPDLGLRFKTFLKNP